jgi:hypothetical protein
MSSTDMPPTETKFKNTNYNRYGSVLQANTEFINSRPSDEKLSLICFNGSGNTIVEYGNMDSSHIDELNKLKPNNGTSFENVKTKIKLIRH